MGGNRIESLQLLSVHLSFVEGKRVFDSSLPTQKSLSNLAES